MVFVVALEASVTFKNKLRGNHSLWFLLSSCFKIFCLPFSCLEFCRLKYGFINYNFSWRFVSQRNFVSCTEGKTERQWKGHAKTCLRRIFVNRVAFCAQYSIEQSRMRWKRCVVHTVGTWLQAVRNIVLAYVLFSIRSNNFSRVSASRQHGLVKMCHGIPDTEFRQLLSIINCGVARSQRRAP